MGNNPVSKTFNTITKPIVNNPVTKTVKKVVDNPITNAVPGNPIQSVKTGINFAKAATGDRDALNQLNPVNKVKDNVNKAKALGNIKNINNGNVGVLSIDGEGVKVKPQFQFSAGGDNFDVGGGLGDVRDGINIGFHASIFRQLCAEGRSYKEVINNLQFCANNELTSEFGKGHDELLQFIKDSNNVSMKVLEKMGINLKLHGVHFKINAKISASHPDGIGIGAKSPWWVDTEGYRMSGVGGKLLKGGCLYAGLHKNNDKVKLEVGFPCVYLKMIVALNDKADESKVNCDESYVLYGATVVIQHENTKFSLHSHQSKFPNGSKQQQVTCYVHRDSNDYWIIRSCHHNLNPNQLYGQKVKNGDTILLQHVNTGAYLHSHSGIASAVTKQQEVTAWWGPNDNDGNSKWKLQIEMGSSDCWTKGDKIKLLHANTNHTLHSHSLNYPDWGFGQQEVTAYFHRDSNDYWFVSNIIS